LLLVIVYIIFSGALAPGVVFIFFRLITVTLPSWGFFHGLMILDKLDWEFYNRYMRLIIRFLLNAVAVYIAAYLLHGVHVSDFTTALLVALLLGVINVTIKPLLFLLTLPITILTLGLFTFVINACMILLVDWLLPSFHVDGFWWALLFSLVLSIVSSLLHTIIE
jgi:putative membrane protein